MSSARSFSCYNLRQDDLLSSEKLGSGCSQSACPGPSEDYEVTLGSSALARWSTGSLLRSPDQGTSFAFLILHSSTCKQAQNHPQIQYNKVLNTKANTYYSNEQINGQLKVTFFYLFFKTVFFYIALSVLELALVDQVSLKLTEVSLPLPPEGLN